MILHGVKPRRKAGASKGRQIRCNYVVSVLDQQIANTLFRQEFIDQIAQQFGGLHNDKVPIIGNFFELQFLGID